MGSLNRFNKMLPPPPKPACGLPVLLGAVLANCCRYIAAGAWQALKFAVQAVILLKIAELVDTITSALIDIAAAQTKIDGLKLQLDKLKSECPDDPAIPDLEKQILGAELDLIKLKDDLEKFQYDAQSLQGEINDLSIESEELENDWKDKCITSISILQWVAMLITLITSRARALLITGQFLLGAVQGVLSRWDNLKQIIDNINVPDPDCDYGGTPSNFTLKYLIDKFK